MGRSGPDHAPPLREGEVPLAGRTVVVTRPPGKAHTLVEPLRELGARVLVCPSIVIAPPENAGPLEEARSRTGSYDWVILTSANGARALAGRIEALDAFPSDGGSGRPERVAVVGSSTRRAAEELLGWAVDLVPRRYTGEGLLDALDAADVDLGGARVLLPVAEAARDVLGDGLRARGARVERVTAYRSVPPDEDAVEPVASALERGGVDLLTFTSPSTAENFLEVAGDGALDVPAAVIGPVTADACREMGYDVVAVAAEHTAEGLIHATVDWLSQEENA